MLKKMKIKKFQDKITGLSDNISKSSSLKDNILKKNGKKAIDLKEDKINEINPYVKIIQKDGKLF